MARSSSASCLLLTSAISHGAVSPLLWKMLHNVWHVPPLSPASSKPVQSRIVLFLPSCVSCFIYGTFLLTSTALSIALVPTLWPCSSFLSNVLSVVFTPCPSHCFSSLCSSMRSKYGDTIVMVYLFLASSSSSIVDFST
jgi:hypothetical protein